MGNTKNAKQKGKSRLVSVLSVLAALLLICLIGMVIFRKGADDPQNLSDAQERPRSEETSAVTEEPSDAAAEKSAALELPYVFENGSLEIASLFQYSGLNPDCGWSEGTDVGAVVLTNRSDRYLEGLNLTVSLTDGTAMSFSIADIPSGKTVWAFETGNQGLNASAALAEVQCSAAFREDSGLIPESVAVRADGMEITLTNLSPEELTGLAVRCHSILDDTYFGGTSYTYPVETIPAGGSTVVFAEDCFLGQTEAAFVNYAN